MFLLKLDCFFHRLIGLPARLYPLYFFTPSAVVPRRQTHSVFSSSRLIAIELPPVSCFFRGTAAAHAAGRHLCPLAHLQPSALSPERLHRRWRSSLSGSRNRRPHTWKSWRGVVGEAFPFVTPRLWLACLNLRHCQQGHRLLDPVPFVREDQGDLMAHVWFLPLL